MTTTKFVAAMSSRIAKTMVDAYRFRNQGANATAKYPARNAFGIKNHFSSNGSHQTINGKKKRYANKKETALFRVFSKCHKTQERETHHSQIYCNSSELDVPAYLADWDSCGARQDRP